MTFVRISALLPVAYRLWPSFDYSNRTYNAATQCKAQTMPLKPIGLEKCLQRVLRLCFMATAENRGLSELYHI